MKKPEIKIILPSWAEKFFAEHRSRDFSGDEDKMLLAVELSHLNVQHRTGGPFGAAIFTRDGLKPVSIGINLVTSTNCCIAHAEIVAIIAAQNRLKTYDLSKTGSGFVLATSTEPCSMCMGAILWAGIDRLLCGATDSDARATGFDEGPKPEKWQQEYRSKGIEVQTELLREEAIKVLESYKQQNGTIYNPKIKIPTQTPVIKD